MGVNNSINTIVGVGKKGANIYWAIRLPEWAAPATRAALRTTGPVPADSRR